MPTKPADAAQNSLRFSVTNTTKGKLPRLPFAEMKRNVLGKSYDLSLVFVGQAKSRRLNRVYRGKDKPTNVLAFPLSANFGEILINLDKARSEAKSFNTTFSKHVGFLFIHGMLHLKGMRHGGRMERTELQLRNRFKL